MSLMCCVLCVCVNKKKLRELIPSKAKHRSAVEDQGFSFEEIDSNTSSSQRANVVKLRLTSVVDVAERALTVDSGDRPMVTIPVVGIVDLLQDVLRLEVRATSTFAGFFLFFACFVTCCASLFSSLSLRRKYVNCSRMIPRNKNKRLCSEFSSNFYDYTAPALYLSASDVFTCTCIATTAAAPCWSTMPARCGTCGYLVKIN